MPFFSVFSVRNMGFQDDIDGVRDGLDYIQLQFPYDLTPGSCFQVVTINYIHTGRLQTLLI